MSHHQHMVQHSERKPAIRHVPLRGPRLFSYMFTIYMCSTNKFATKNKWIYRQIPFHALP